MTKKLHVLIIPSWYPAYPGDISGSFFREQALALQNSGVKAGVIFPQVRSLRNIKDWFNLPYGLQKNVDLGLPTFRWHAINLTPRLVEIQRKNWIKYGLHLFDCYVKEHGRPDIIHVHSMINAGFLASKINEKYSIPYVITEHFTGYARKTVPSKTIKLLEPIVKKASICYAVSNEFSELLNKVYDTKRWGYLPNIVNDSFFKNELKNPNIYKFVNICFLDKKKRVDLLLNAFSLFLEDNQNVELVIGGDGPERQNLEQLSVDLGISNNVRFLGMLSRDQVVEVVSDSSCFVLSSDYETFGVVIIEALALGKPVIATKCGGPESIVTPLVGHLVEKNSVEALVKAMVLMYERQDDYNSEIIRNYCKENFSEKSVINRLVKNYNYILEN